MFASSTLTQLRGKELRTTQLSQFDGSAWYGQGQTAVMAAVCGPVAARGEQEDYRRCVIEVAVVRNTQNATAGGAERNIVDRRKRSQQTSDAELALFISSILQEVILVDLFPRCALQVSVDVLSDDGSLWSIAMNAVMCALLDAAVPCRTTFAASQILASFLDASQLRPTIQMRVDPTQLEEKQACNSTTAATTTVSCLLVHGLGAAGGGTLGSSGTQFPKMDAMGLSDVHAIESPAKSVGTVIQILQKLRSAAQSRRG